MIAGILATSYVDYPGEPSFVIFLGGCNFRCPFCHNKSIVLKENPIYETEEVLTMLTKRKKFIKAVVITGGEPTIWQDKLKALIINIKALGYKVKLDTNGTNPKLLKELIAENLIDYFAMDIKNTFTKYEITCGTKIKTSTIKESIQVIEDSGIDYQFRTTINKTMHTKKDKKEILTYLKDQKKHKFQDYKYSDQQLIKKDFGKYEEE